MATKSIGFIILRHVNSPHTNVYWMLSYDSIRKFYPENDIIIIDDNSQQGFITSKTLYKTTIIEGEYPKRGELLPYIYFLRRKPFDIAVILHDSVFINKYIDFSVETYKMLWHFTSHSSDQIADEKKMLNTSNNPAILKFHENKKLWNGCFGGMSIISYEYLHMLNSFFKIDNLIDFVTTRFNRMSLERVLAVILQFGDRGKHSSMYGDIKAYMPWDVKIENMNKFRHLPLIKVWTGR
jgi:hypothetical protein